VSPYSPLWSWNATETGPGRAFGRALFREAGIAWIADEDTPPGGSGFDNNEGQQRRDVEDDP
jgi:hypothetical protein